MAKFNLNVNGKVYHVDVAPDMPLVWVIRDFVGLKGTKFGCGAASCGACTLHLDGNAVRSCQIPISAIAKKSKITTIEGISDATLHPVQQAWIDLEVPQCGYCQTGQIMSAVSLLEKNSNPTDQQIDSALKGNICRCGTYDRIRKAIHRTAEQKS